MYVLVDRKHKRYKNRKIIKYTKEQKMETTEQKNKMKQNKIITASQKSEGSLFP